MRIIVVHVRITVKGSFTFPVWWVTSLLLNKMCNCFRPFYGIWYCAHIHGCATIIGLEFCAFLGCSVYNWHFTSPMTHHKSPTQSVTLTHPTNNHLVWQYQVEIVTERYISSLFMNKCIYNFWRKDSDLTAGRNDSRIEFGMIW